MTHTVVLTLPETSRALLADLHDAVRAAQRQYNLAHVATFRALNLDPNDRSIELDIDTGQISRPAPAEPPPSTPDLAEG